MRPRLHKCAVPHCPCQVPRHLLMCMEHWRMVPAPLRREVTAAWKHAASLAKHQGRPDLHAQRAWQVVADQAAQAVTAKVQSRQAELTEKFGDLFASTDSRDKNDIHGTTTQPGGRAQA